MSDNWIIIIPGEPNYVPPRDAQERAVSLFKSFAPRADEIRMEVSDAIRFIDCGANFSAIFCPHCRKEVSIDWWQEAMKGEAEAGFPLNQRMLPCCAASATLHDLKYDWPQGFARFSLEVMNAGIGDLSPEQLTSLEQALECPIRKILQHF